MKRRQFITLLGGAAAAWPLAGQAQQGERMRRIGVLLALGEDDLEGQARLAAFRQGLEQRGWSEARNVRIDARFSAEAGQFQMLAKELIALQPDVILSHTTPVTAALQRESRTVPIVFVYVSDPIGSGFVAGLARPGGNLTGLLQYEASVTGKWLGMLREVAPGIARVALLGDPITPTYEYFLRAAEVVSPSLGITLVPSPIHTAANIEHAVEMFAQAPNGALFLPPNNTTIWHRALIIALAARHLLPAVYALRVFVEAGGLMSYGVDEIGIFRQAASYVDRILRGAQPDDLPVQTPLKYETVVNLKTAKTLGLEVPPTLLARADEVIE
jgi:putative ABC transport system substrate-binding protein